MKLGYIRVSSEDQNTARQVDALRDLCDELMIEKASAGARKRPVLEAALARLAEGDAFVIYDLDRAFRSAIDALLTAENLRKRGVDFQIVANGLDTSSDMGQVIYGVMAVFAQHELKTIRRRTREGLEAAKRSGKKLGPPHKLTSAQIDHARRVIEDGQETVASMARTFKVHRSTLGRALLRQSNVE